MRLSELVISSLGNSINTKHTEKNSCLYFSNSYKRLKGVMLPKSLYEATVTPINTKSRQRQYKKVNYRPVSLNIEAKIINKM